jgi:2-methylaconitate cis-trans-isomerase PrpF
VAVVPPPGPLRDAALKRVMGTPDGLQIDGMGGTNLTTSKIAIIKKSERDDAVVDVGIEDDTISYSANCGNISSGVDAFAIDESLVTKFIAGKPINYKILD